MQLAMVSKAIDDILVILHHSKETWDALTRRQMFKLYTER